MKMLKSALAGVLAFALAFAPSLAFAQAGSTLGVLNGAGGAETLAAIIDASSHKITGAWLADHLGNVIDPATSGNQTTANASLASIATNTTGASTAANQATGNTTLGTIATNTTSIATAANQTSANTKLDTLHTDLGTLATAAAQTTANASLASIAANTAAAPAGFAATASTTVTRPADANPYAINDAWADSTSSPTTGGFTFSSVCSASGKTSRLVSLVVVSTIDPATTLQGELWLFDSAATAVNDNAAFALSDTDAVKLVGKIPFALESSTGGSGTNSIYTVTGLDLAFTCVGTANLRFLVKVKNVYTPASAEALTFRATVKGDS